MTAALAAVFISSCAEFTVLLGKPQPFEPGAGGGPGPQGCQQQKERAREKGETPTC